MIETTTLVKEESNVINKPMLSSILEAFGINLTGIYFDILLSLMNKYRNEQFCFVSDNSNECREKNEGLEILFSKISIKLSYYLELGVENKKVYLERKEWQQLLVPIDYRTQEQEKTFVLGIINKYLRKYEIKFEIIKSPLEIEKELEEDWPFKMGFNCVVYEIPLSDEQFEKLENAESFHA